MWRRLPRFRWSPVPRRMTRRCHSSTTRPVPWLLRPPSTVMWCTLGTVSLLTASSVVLAAMDYTVEEAEELYLNPDMDRRQVLSYLRSATEVHPTNVELLWRLARAEYDVGQRKTTMLVEKKEMTYAAHKSILVAMHVNPDHFAVQKWAGIILSAIGDFENTKEAIANAYIIRDHWHRATELNPQDATSWHLLGRWCVSIANISWLQRNVAAALFGSPPTATLDEAIEYFLKAEAISPKFWKKNAVMLADCYLKQRKIDEARHWISVALNIPTKTEEDEEAHALALHLDQKVG